MWADGCLLQEDDEEETRRLIAEIEAELEADEVRYSESTSKGF